MSDRDEDFEMLAAEYVLGTLDAATAESVAKRADQEPALQALIEDWERRLMPLAALAAPVAPPAALWQRLETSIEPQQQELVGRVPGRAAGRVSGRVSGGVSSRILDSIAFWRGATGLGFALAASLAAFVLWRPTDSVPVAALVPPNGAPAAFVAERQPDGRLRLVQIGRVEVAQGKSLQLWALAPGATRPVSLGVIPASGDRVAPSPAVSGTQIMVSLEPRGGSPTGLPTGPVLYAGLMRNID